tara:strand:- start:3900 stop:4481 length:582 start_codon:yes stop_codon:yes gene_type:complete
MILVVNIGYDQIYKLTDLIDIYIDVKTIPIFDLEEEHVINDDVSGLIISNGSISVHDQSTELYLKKLSFLKEMNIPILGIGAGHHLLGLLFGSQTVYSPYVNDVVTVGIVEEDDTIFSKLPLEIEMSKEHAGSISIPPDFTLLASSDGSINEAMKHKDLPLYGIQFLPERSGNFGAIIIENFVEISERYSSNN